MKILTLDNSTLAEAIVYLGLDSVKGYDGESTIVVREEFDTELKTLYYQKLREVEKRLSLNFGSDRGKVKRDLRKYVYTL